jgi:hypothetical protein
MRLLAACDSVGEGPQSDLAYLAVKGTVGDGAADSFIGWFREMDLPDPEILLKDPVAAQEILKGMRPDKLQVALESVANAACQDHKNIDKRWTDAWAVIGPTIKTQPDNGLYAAKILSAAAMTKVKDVPVPPEVKLVRELLGKVFG